MNSLLKSRRGRRRAVEASPERAGWTYLDLAVVELDADGSYDEASGDREVVVVPISGRGLVRAGAMTLPTAGVQMPAPG